MTPYVPPCADDPELFFLTAPRGNRNQWERDNYDDLIKLAKRLCGECLIQKVCRAEGMGHEYGIWGGLTPKERDQKRAEQDAA